MLLTRSPKQVFVGMVICAFAIGGSEGIVYLRAEYWYLKDYLEAQLEEMRQDGLLGAGHRGATGVPLRHPHPDGCRRLRVR